MDAKQVARQELDRVDNEMLLLVLEAKAVGITANELREFFNSIKGENNNGTL